jgi:hypothetical protein
MIRQESSEVTVPSGIISLPPFELLVPAVTGELTARAVLTHEGHAPVEGRAGALVLAPPDGNAEGLAVSLVDPEGTLGTFLGEAGASVRDFRNGEPCAGPVFVTAGDASSDTELQTFRALFEQVAGGGTAVFLRPPMDTHVFTQGQPTWQMKHEVVSTDNRLLRSGVFPLRPVAREARGNWIGLFHAVREHPIFEGLPSNTLMGQVYANVFARQTMVGVPGQPVAATVSLDWTRAYIGLTDVWVGADVAVVPHGRGRLVLSALNLLPHLGRDPVADRLLRNMVRFASDGERG